MKLAMTVPYGSTLLFDDSHASIIASVLGAQCVTEEGYGDKRKFVPSSETIKLSLVRDEDLAEKPEPLLKLQEQKAETERRWLEQYNAANQYKARVKELEDKLASLSAAVAS